MFVGESGVARIIQRTCEVMREHRHRRPRAGARAGVIDLPTIQRYLNFHYSVTIDLFGADQSSNAAIFYSAGLKGRFEETKRDDDHVLKGATYPILDVVRRALRRARRADAERAERGAARRLHPGFGAACRRWNKVIEKHGVRVPAAGAAQGVQPPHRHARRTARHAGGPHRRRRDRGRRARANGCRRRRTARSSRR